MRTYLCKLPEGLEWYPVRAWGPQQAAEDFALMWIGPRLERVRLEATARNDGEELIRAELAYKGRFMRDGRERVTVLVKSGGKTCPPTY